MTLGERLRQARKNKGLKLTDVQELMGVSQSYLSKIELGKRRNPSWDLLNDLARLYEIDLKWLVSEMNENRDQKIDSGPAKKELIVGLLDELDDKDLDRLLLIIQSFIIGAN